MSFEAKKFFAIFNLNSMVQVLFIYFAVTVLVAGVFYCFFYGSNDFFLNKK